MATKKKQPFGGKQATPFGKKKSDIPGKKHGEKITDRSAKKKTK